MPYFIIPDEKQDCVFLTCEGDMSLVEIRTAWSEVRGLLATTQWRRVLLDITALRTRPDSEQLFDLGNLIRRDFPLSGRIALAVRWDQAGFGKLLEMSVRTLGVYLKMFVNQEQAEAWILGEPPHNHHVPMFNSSSGACCTGGASGELKLVY